MGLVRGWFGVDPPKPSSSAAYGLCSAHSRSFAGGSLPCAFPVSRRGPSRPLLVPSRSLLGTFPTFAGGPARSLLERQPVARPTGKTQRRLETPGECVTGEPLRKMQAGPRLRRTTAKARRKTGEEGKAWADTSRTEKAPVTDRPAKRKDRKAGICHRFSPSPSSRQEDIQTVQDTR